MAQDYYEKLREALDRLPGGFPSVPSRVELQILKRIFSPEEARIAAFMTGTRETATAIAARAGIPEAETERILRNMAKRTIIWGSPRDGVWQYRLAPYVVGFYEEQWANMDHELAHLCEEYWLEGGLAGIMRHSPPLNRVVPASRAVKRELILPYDDVKAILMEGKSFEVRDCICRIQQDLVGKRKCRSPLRICLNFSPNERPKGPNNITKDEALGLLDEAEEIGLVHTVANIAKGISFVCNCCGCCCAVLRGITQLGIENSVAKANYYAVVDPDACTACGICEERCQVGACKVDDIARIDLKKCIGCGLCATGCVSQAVSLRRRPENETVQPPETYKVWEQERLKSRGLLG
ncbi:MAG: 4Fe-4S binding protein [Dehalococcoidia bacterium]|nr:4Fe-4S binding protein [Dehalococcoidia bacterium]